MIVDRLLEHLRPRLVLVATSGPVMCSLSASPEPTPSENRPGIIAAAVAAGVGDDRRVGPHRRTGHARRQPEPLRRLGDRADDAPDKRALALGVDPRMEVVGDRDVVEAERLCALGVPDEVERRMLLGLRGRSRA